MRGNFSSLPPVAPPGPVIDWAAVEIDAAHLLSRYLQFDTTNPPGNEAMAVAFLAETLRGYDFEPRVITSAPGRSNLVVRLPGRNDTDLPPCLLYAHADVVPADAADWSVPPFSGQIKDGFVWGRGALDDKGLGVVFLQALTLLKRFAPPPARDIILLIASDEETCGRQGVAWLLDHHPELIRAGFVWDEGGMGVPEPANPDRFLYAVGIAEKGAMAARLVASAPPGHASMPREGAPDRLVQALSRIKRWKEPARLTGAVQEMLQALASSQPFPRSYLFARAANPLLWPLVRPWLETDPLLSPLIGNTVSLTMLHAGQKSNIIPARAEAVLDIRLLPGEDPARVIAALRSLVSDLNVTVQVEESPTPYAPTTTDTDFYRSLAETLRQLDPGGLVIPYLTPGTTDSRFFRRAGMQAYGFMPMLLDNRELSRIHGIDERVSTANLRWGTQVVFDTLCRL